MKKIPLPSQERLRELFHYNPETGIVTRKITTAPNAKAGMTVGIMSNQGYYDVSIAKTFYRLHRIIWMLHYGEDPGEMHVDHINQDRLDNRLCNLRLATHSQNVVNRSGNTGVTYTGYRWKAVISYLGKKYHLGCFESYQQAHECYLRARSFFFQEFAPQT